MEFAPPTNKKLNDDASTIMIDPAASPEPTPSHSTLLQPPHKALSSSSHGYGGWEFAEAPPSTTATESEAVSLGRSIFATEEIKGRQDVFIAGRGGEAIFHTGNVAFRQRVLEHTETYARLRTCERGRRFARQLLYRYFSDVTFVVRHSYFFRNFQKGTISKEKIESVRKEHGGSFDSLNDIPADHYFTVGETWILGIISDIVRFGGKKTTTAAPKNNKRQASGGSFSSATVSDDESASSVQGAKKRSRRHTMGASAVPSSSPCIVPSGQGASKRARRRHTVGVAPPPEVLSSAAAPRFVVDAGARGNAEGVLEALVKEPLPSAEEEASMFTDEEMVLDVFGDVVPL